MAAIFSFKCSDCGNIHEGSPSYGFRAPAPYLEQSKQVQDAGRLTSDLCEYADEEGEHYFVRGCIEIPIHGVADPFLWGVWVSLSRTNYDRYVATYDAPVSSDAYFGWLCNYLPWYEETYALKTQVKPRLGGVRPNVTLEKTSHPLSVDLYEGITIEKAQQIAKAIMHK